jgi:antibiotic biosynthesis monooxygenase (ABM) superfamily enzyme
MKMKAKLVASLKIWAVIYPSITLFLYFFGAALAAMPLYQRTLVLTLALVPWIVFAGVPLLDSAIRLISGPISKDKTK